MISFWFQDSLFSLRVHIPVSLQSRYLNGLHFLHWGRWTPVHVRSVHFCDLQVAWVALLWSDKYCYSSCDPVFNTNSVATLCRQLQEKQALGIFSVESSLAKTKFTFCQKRLLPKSLLVCSSTLCCCCGCSPLYSFWNLSGAIGYRWDWSEMERLWDGGVALDAICHVFDKVAHVWRRRFHFSLALKKPPRFQEFKFQFVSDRYIFKFMHSS